MRRPAACLLVLLAGCARPARPLSVTAAPAAASPGGRVGSNVTRADYAGSATCAACHPTEHDAWQRSPMHRMTRLVDGAEIRAPFGGEAFVFKRDRVVLDRQGGDRRLTIENARTGRRVFVITRVLGGRVREDFVGVEVDAAGRRSTDERVLPVSFVLGERAYRYKGYSVMTPERPELRPGAPWRRTCIFCHNTEPLLDTLLAALAPRAGPYQGEVVDALLPAARRQRWIVTDGEAFRRALDDELRAIGAPPTAGGDPVARATEAIRALRRRFDGKHLLEVGIGCESCHGGSREHVAHSSVRPSLEPRSPFLRAEPPGPTHAAAVNRVCARCHQVLFTGYPYTWEGGRRGDAVPGGSHINSGEARDFLLGACAGELACTACHDPHAHDGERARAELDGPAGNRVCLPCHAKYAAPEALRAHAHHDPAGAGGACMACHMARKNMTLDTRLGRYHRIGSPTDPTRVERDRPLECALCHADQRVGELVETMTRWWGKTYDAGALAALYGEPSANVLRATLALGKPHEQAAAIHALGEAGAKDAAPLVALQLTHGYPILRYYARAALERLIGAPPAPLDLHAENAAIEASAAAWLAAAGQRPLRPPSAKGAAPLPALTDGED